jgi:hypothetical protein
MKLTKGRLSKIKKMKRQTRHHRRNPRKGGSRETNRIRKSKHFLYKSLKKRRRVQKGGVINPNEGLGDAVKPVDESVPAGFASRAGQAATASGQAMGQAATATGQYMAPTGSMTERAGKSVGRAAGRTADAGRAAGAAAKRGATQAYQGTRFGLGDEALDRTIKIPLSKCDKGMALADWPKGEDGTERKIAGAYWEDDKCIARGRQGGKKVVLSAGIFINEGGYKSDDSTNWPRDFRATRDIEGLHNALILDIEKQSDDSHVLTVQKNVYRTLDKTPVKITISENNPKPGWTWKISETTEDQNLLWCIVELVAGKRRKRERRKPHRAPGWSPFIMPQPKTSSASTLSSIWRKKRL